MIEAQIAIVNVYYICFQQECVYLELMLMNVVLR